MKFNLKRYFDKVYDLPYELHVTYDCWRNLRGVFKYYTNARMTFVFNGETFSYVENIPGKVLTYYKGKKFLQTAVREIKKAQARFLDAPADSAMLESISKILDRCKINHSYRQFNLDLCGEQVSFTAIQLEKDGKFSIIEVPDRLKSPTAYANEVIKSLTANIN